MARKKASPKSKAKKASKKAPKKKVVKKKVEAPKVEAPKAEAPECLGFLGAHRMKILSVKKVVINGKEVNEILLADGSTTLLGDEELEVQKNQ